VFAESYDRLVDLDRQIQGYLDKIETVYRQSPACQKLGAIPGLGPLTATAMVAAMSAGKWRRGWVSCRGRSPVAANRGSWASASAAIPTGAPC
jgi:hypothetical protein